MKCPSCGLHNPDSARRCDCGFDFKSYDKPKIPEQSYADRAVIEGSGRVLIYGILGIVVCSLFAPYAWHLGNRLISKAKLHGIKPDWVVVVGRILGIVGTCILIATLLFLTFIFVNSQDIN